MSTSGLATPPISPSASKPKIAEVYTPIPSFPASLGGEWKNLAHMPYLNATMRFPAGTRLPPHHFPAVVRIVVVRGSIRLDDLQNNQGYLIGQYEDCMIPAKLIHEIECLEDVEFEFAMNCTDMVIYWDLEER